MSFLARRAQMNQSGPGPVFNFMGSGYTEWAFGVTNQPQIPFGLGSPAANRVVVVALHVASSYPFLSISNVQMGGVALTRIVRQSVDYNDIELWWGTVPTGTSQNLTFSRSRSDNTAWIRAHVGTLYGSFSVSDSKAAANRTVNGLVVPNNATVLSAWCEDYISPSSIAGLVLSTPMQGINATNVTGTSQSGLCFIDRASMGTYAHTVFWYLGDTSPSRPAHISCALVEN